MCKGFFFSKKKNMYRNKSTIYFGLEHFFLKSKHSRREHARQYDFEN